MDGNDMAAQIRVLGPWHQHIIFPGGIEVGHHPASEIANWFFDRVTPAEKAVLDLGCNAGMMCREAELRGACQTVGIDASLRLIAQARFVQAQFDLQHLRLGIGDIYRIDPAEVAADLVLFCGIYYHLWHPMLGLDLAWRCTREALLVEGHVAEGEELVMRFAPGYDGDPTNWWHPTVSCLEAMLNALGGVASIETAQPDFVGSTRRIWCVRRVPGTWTAQSNEISWT